MAPRRRRWDGCAPPTGTRSRTRIKYWGIGNEMWGDWQYGYMALDQWIAKQGQFARAMRKADPDDHCSSRPARCRMR